MSRFYNYINEEWNIKPTSSSGNAYGSIGIMMHIKQ